jgi:hypothetical protein
MALRREQATLIRVDALERASAAMKSSKSSPAIRPGARGGERHPRSGEAGCASCGVYRAANLEQARAWHHGLLGLRGGAGRESQHGQEHGVQCAHRLAAAHRQLAGQDGDPRRRGLRLRRKRRFKLVDLPGTYSLLSTSLDEQIARDFILFGQPDVTVIVARRDAPGAQPQPRLCRSSRSPTALWSALNLMDEAQRHGIHRGRPATRARPAACRWCRRRRATVGGMPQLLESDRLGVAAAKSRLPPAAAGDRACRAH